MAGTLHITVNGQQHQVTATPDTPLLYVLRNELRLNGPQYGCGLEQCGACMVLIGGKAVPSCMLPVSATAGAPITTLEGLGTIDRPHPVQQAFIQEQAGQCAVCINGMIMATAALLATNPNPTDEEIRAGLARNLCRCGAHTRILRAVKRATAGIEQQAAGASGQASQATVTSAAAPKTPGMPSAWLPASIRSEQGSDVATIPQDQLDSWLEFDEAGHLTIYSGKVELGTGTATALSQIVAEELDLPLAQVSIVMGDTARTPDQGYTAGSKTIQVAGVALRQVAAQARSALLQMAAERLAVPAQQLRVEQGLITVAGEPEKSVSYAALIGGRHFNLPITGDAPTKLSAEYTLIGQPVTRLDLPGKLTGQPSFIHDLRLPGMLHGRMVRPSAVGADLESIDENSVKHLPGLVKVVRNGNFVGVIAEREEQAIRAARLLKATWREPVTLPPMAELPNYLRNQRTEDKLNVAEGDIEAGFQAAARRIEATYSQPYQAHASLVPSCAVADVRDGQAVVWSSTQGVYQLQGALAELAGIPRERIQVIHVEGAGCYGHNGFDDVAADALLLSQAVGRPVRVQWSRRDENVWAPKGPAMVMEVSGGLDPDGNVIAWDYQVWTPTHTNRPGGQAGNLLAGQQIVPGFRPRTGYFGGGDRNVQHPYRFPNSRIVTRWLLYSPIRQSAFRSLGGMANTFANESFMDELAAAAGVDAVEFRLRHLDDPRAHEAIAKAAERAAWQKRPSPAGQQAATLRAGRGIAYARYENKEAYVATIAEVLVDLERGQIGLKRLVVAHDCGQIINPDGLANQIEGNAIQSASRALKEQVSFDRSRITAVDWLSYPILTFPEVPHVEVVLIDRPDSPPFGAGEPSTVTTAPAIANAIFDATGIRLRSIPLANELQKAMQSENA